MFRTIYNRGTLGFDQQARFFARRGYVVLVQGERGRYDADGSFYAFKNEANDGYDTDEWIGRQPWFDGNLGAMGGSYGGYVQWAQAVGGSKYLKEIFPEVTTGDIYNNWIYSDGALHYGFALPWGGVELDGHTNQFDAATDWAQAFPHLPVSTADEAAGHRTPHYRDWIRHPTRDSYWDGINWDDDYEKISTPAFSADGWYDIFVRGALSDDIQIRKRGKTRESCEYKHITIGPWAHSEGGRVAITGRSSDPTPPDFGDNAVVDIDKLALRWHDYWLKGIDNGVVNEPPVKIFVMGENY